MKQILILSFLLIITYNSIAQCGSMTASGSSSASDCTGAMNWGSATAIGSGGLAPYNYSWSNGATSSTISQLFQGVYTSTVTDANGCLATVSVTINTPPAMLSVTATSTNPACATGSMNWGSVTALESGGTAPYSFAWSNGANTPTINNLNAGTYTTTITDANGCTAIDNATITVPTELTVSISSTNPTCAGNMSWGSATVNSSGGTGSSTYIWSNGSTSSTINNLPAGNYTTTVTDANGCSTIDDVTITSPPPLTGNNNTVICSSGSININGTTYDINNQTGTEVFTSANGCDSIVTVALNIQGALDLSISINGDTLTANQNGANYQWVDCDNANTQIPNATSQSFTVTETGNYAVTVISTPETCEGTSDCESVTISFVGVDEKSDLLGLSIFPNPTKGPFLITLNKISANDNIIVYTVLGKEIINQQIVNTSTNIDLSKFDKGFYLVKIQNGNNIITKKLERQ